MPNKGDSTVSQNPGLHSIVRVAEQMGWKIEDATRFLAKLKNVEYGLSAETEFAALLMWLGSCTLINSLGQDGPPTDGIRVPDLFAIFQHDGAKLGAVIEVKTSKKPHLSFRREYLEGLYRYSEAIGHRLLLAWKNLGLGIWVLFDPACGTWEADRWTVDSPTAFKHNLMGVVARELYAAPYRGPYLELSGPIVEIDKNRAGQETGFSYQIDSAQFMDRDGVELTPLAQPVSALLYATIEPVLDIDRERKRATVRYFVEETLVPVQKLLKMLAGDQFREGDRVRWREVANKMNSVISYEELQRHLRDALGEEVKLIFRLIPTKIPEYVPQIWRRKVTR